MDEKVGLELELQGEEKIGKAAETLADLKARFDEVGVAISDLAARQAALDASMASSTVTTAAVQAGTEEASKGFREWAKVGLNLAEAVDESDGKLKGLLGTLPLIVGAFGAGALAVEGVSTAVGILKNHWKDLSNLFNVNSIGIAREGLEKLEHDLDRAQKKVDAFYEKGTIGGFWGGPTEREEFENAKQELKDLRAEKQHREELASVKGIEGREITENREMWARALKEAGGGDAVANALASALEEQSLYRDPFTGRARVTDPRTGQDLDAGRLAGNMAIDAAKGDSYAQQFVMRNLRNTAIGTTLESWSPEAQKAEEKRQAALDKEIEAAEIQRENQERAAATFKEWAEKLKDSALTMATRGQKIDAAAVKHMLSEQFGLSQDEAAVLADGIVKAIADNLKHAWKMAADKLPMDVAAGGHMAMGMGLATPDEEEKQFQKMLEGIQDPVVRRQMQEQHYGSAAMREYRAAIASYYDMSMMGASRGEKQMLRKQKAMALRAFDVDKALINGEPIKGRNAAERFYIANMRKMLGDPTKRREMTRAYDTWRVHVDKFGEYVDRLMRNDLRIVL